MVEFHKVRINDLGRVVTGKTPPSSKPELFGVDYPFLTPTDIDGAARYIEPERFLSSAGYKYQQRLILPARSVCIVCIGATIGKACMTSRPSFTNQQINSVIVNEAEYDPFFVYHLMTTLRDELRANAGGAATPIINKSAFSEIEISVPPLPIQRRIAGILSAYDELIENSQRRIKILEAMARALYREWFVHFRFPGHEGHPRVASALGEIPAGWEVSSFEKAATFENGDRGKNYPNVSEFVDEGVPFINAGHLIDGAIDLNRVNRITEAKFEQLRSGKVREGDILYCLRGSPGRTARATQISRGAIASSLVIIRPTLCANYEFLFYTLSGERGSQMVAELDNGVAQPNISVSSVQKYPILLPSREVLHNFAVLIEPYWKLIDALRAQLYVLRAQRDLLLPRLLAGEVELG